MEIVGRQIEVGVGIEETRGTAVTTADKWIKNTTATVVEHAEKAIDESKRGVLEDSLGARVVKKWIEGDIEGNLHADVIGYLLLNLYGASASTSLGSSVYSHNFTVDQTIEHPSLSIFAKDGGVQQKVMSGCMISKLELSAEIGKYISYTASFMGKAAASNSDTPSYDTEYDFVTRDITLKMADTEGGLSGASAIKIKDVKLTFDTGLIQDFVVGSYTPDDNYNAKMAIEGEFTLNYTDNTYKDLFLANTEKYLQLAIVGEANIGGGANPTLTLLCNKVQILDWNRDGSADELVTQPIKFKAFYNETDSQQSEVTLINLTTEYEVPVSA